MGKYSLESFERYPTVKCRPREAAGRVENCGCGSYTEVPCRWRDTEPTRGGFCFDAALMALRAAKTALLTLDWTPPAWAGSDPGDFLRESWLRRAAKALSGGRDAFAVLPPGPGAAERLTDALFAAFDQTRMLFSIFDAPAIEYARRRGYPFGLLAEAGENPWACCDAFARLGLQRVWEQAPVLARNRGCAPGLFQKLTEQWHCSALERGGENAGFRLALRRLTYPAQLTAGGAAPLRFWWVNSGTSPCYQPTRVRLRLAGGAGEIPLSDSLPLLPVGDRTFNEITRLPDVPPGEYTLQCGVFGPEEKPLRLAMEGEAGDGFYTVGRLVLDGLSRPGMENAWEDYYPEGYYPLEDPALPGE